MPSKPASASPSRQARTPPELKWLLNERAALLGRLERQQKALTRQSQTVATAEQALQAALARLAALERQAEDARATVQALEVTIRLGFPEVDPLTVGPVNEHTRFGRRGALIEFLLQATTEAGSQGLTTGQLTGRARDAFGVPTTNREERELLRYTVRSRMRELRDLHGLVVDQRGPAFNSGTTWRRVAAPTFADLMGLAPSAGHSVPVASDDRHTSHANALRGEVAGERARGACGPDAAG